MAQVSFYRGNAEYFSATSHKDGIYFATNTGQIFVNDKVYGLTDDQIKVLNGGLVANLSVENGKLLVQFVGSESAQPLGYLLTEDQEANLEVLSGLVSGGALKTATTTQDGLMTSAQVLMLESLKDLEGGDLSTITGEIDSLKEAVTGLQEGLTGAFHFKGKEGSIPTENSGYASGDVILVGTKEYVFVEGVEGQAGEWVEFGDNGDLVTKGELSALESIVTGHTTSITGINSSIETINANYTSLSGQVSTLNGTVGTLEDSINGIIGDGGILNWIEVTSKPTEEN